MNLILSSLLILAAAEAGPPMPTLVPPEEAANRLEACGLADVDARYDDTLQDHALLVGDPAPADAVLACAAEVSIATGYWVDTPESSRDAYFAHYRRLSREHSREWARARLAEQGLLDTVPAYVSGETDDRAFADRLEDLCGAAAKGALQSGYGAHAISPTWAERGRETGEVMMCLMTYAAAAEYDLGFVGNEKAAAPN